MAKLLRSRESAPTDGAEIVGVLLGLLVGFALVVSPFAYAGALFAQPTMGGAAWLVPTALVALVFILIRYRLARGYAKPGLGAFSVSMLASYGCTYVFMMVAFSAVGSVTA